MSALSITVRTLLGTRALRVLAVVLAFFTDLGIWGGDSALFNGQTFSNVWIVVVIMVATYSCLVIWRSPIPGYTAMWLLSIMGFVVPATESFVGFLVALFLMARLMPRTIAVMALIGSAVPVAANTLIDSPFAEPDVLFMVQQAGLWVFLILAVWGAGRALARGDHRIAVEMVRADEAAAEAVQSERVRISRELHDIVGHSLSGIVLLAAGAQSASAKTGTAAAGVDGALSSIQAAAAESMRELHRLLGMLRDTERTEVSLEGIDGIRDLVDSVRDSGLRADLRVIGTPTQVDPSIGHTAFRVVQEGLSNVMKHSGRASSTQVTLTWKAHGLNVGVDTADPATAGADGTGTDTSAKGGSRSKLPQGGFGLVGLRERVGVSGGTMIAGPTEAGYRVSVTLPVADSTAPGVTSSSAIAGRVAPEPTTGTPTTGTAPSKNQEN